MANTTISALPAAISIDGSGDYFPIDTATPNATNKINRNTFLGVSGQPADISTTQNLTNKTLNNTNTITVRDDRFTLQDNLDTTKQAVFQLSGITTATTRTYTLPNASITVVGTDATQVLTNKTITAPAITGGTIDNSTVTVDAIAGHTSATVVTVAGLQINAGVLATNNSVVTANITDSAVTPAKLQAGTGTGWTWQTWTPTWTNLTVGNGTIVARYNQTGKTVNAHIELTFGSTTSISGQVDFTLPITASSTYLGNNQIGTGSLEDFGITIYDPWIITSGGSPTTKCVIHVKNAAGTYVSFTALSSTIPFTWGNGDIIHVNIKYEAA